MRRRRSSVRLSACPGLSLRDIADPTHRGLRQPGFDQRYDANDPYPTNWDI